MQVEGKITHPPDEDPWEYTVVVLIRNERGQEIARHVINVGALSNSEQRIVSLAVDVMPPKAVVAMAPKPAAASSPLPAKTPLVPPPPAAARPAQPPTPPTQPLRPAKETLTPPKPGDPYPSNFGRGPKPR